MSYQVLVEYLPQGSRCDICVLGYGIVVLEVTVHFSSVFSLKSDVGIENMRQEEFIFFLINVRLIIVLVHTAHHTATDIHVENSINCMGTSG
jgi:hypothetical protein